MEHGRGFGRIGEASIEEALISGRCVLECCQSVGGIFEG